MRETSYLVCLTVNGEEVEAWRENEKDRAYDRFEGLKSGVSRDAGIWYEFGDFVQVTLDDGVWDAEEGFEKHARHEVWQVKL